MQGADYFFNAISPTVSLTCVLGICPVFIGYKEKRPVLYTHKYLYYISVAFVLFYSFLLLQTISETRSKMMSNNFYQSNKVSNVGIAFEFFASVTYFYSTYFSCVLKADSLKNTIMKIHKVDVVLERMGQDLRYKQMIFYQLATQLPPLLTIIVNAYMQNQNIKREGFRPISLSTWFIFVFPVYVVNIFEYQFSYIVLLVHSRFAMLNSQLRKLKEHEGKVFQWKLEDAQLPETLRKVDTLMRMYDHLCDVACELSVNYTLPVVVILAFQYGIILFSIFYCYWMFTLKPYSALCWLIWALINITEVLHTSIACHLASVEASVTASVVHKLLLKSYHKEVMYKLMSFSRLLMHRRVKFTIWGMFPYDASLIFIIVGAAATYMTIMLQFQQASLPMTCKVSTVNNNSAIH
ncbi:putative gustatory receptor 28a [Photinus pyralis]|uniref:putative gustatory receptor 28a n=1 Tax=Photinus pyralis TaxID=7054 RepID=UPI001266F4C4|nr:putative gustatory receptor 28a [Photinus pyralis]